MLKKKKNTNTSGLMTTMVSNTTISKVESKISAAEGLLTSNVLSAKIS